MNVNEFDRLFEGFEARKAEREARSRAEAKASAEAYHRAEAERKRQEYARREPTTIEHAIRLANKQGGRNDAVVHALCAVAGDRGPADLLARNSPSVGLGEAARILAAQNDGPIAAQFRTAAQAAFGLPEEAQARIVIGLCAMVVDLREQLEARQALESPIVSRGDLIEELLDV